MANAGAGVDTVSILLNTCGSACVGDCNGDHSVTADEVISGIDIALGEMPLAQCAALDCHHSGVVTIDCLVQAVRNVLNGCAPL